MMICEKMLQQTGELNYDVLNAESYHGNHVQRTKVGLKNNLDLTSSDLKTEHHDPHTGT
jgi:hypothetical protein